MSSAVHIRTTSRAHTAEVGARLAMLLVPGDVVILTGELGAGKTAFTSGIAAGLGCDEPVTSPTFTIMRHHSIASGGQLLHLDAYRLGGPADAEDIGLLELLDDGAIAVIEWGERIVAALGDNVLRITFAHSSGDDDRELTFAGAGMRWDEVNLAGVLAC